MGYVSREPVSREPRDSESTEVNGRDKEIETLKKKIESAMDLISKRNSIVEKLNDLDAKIDEMMSDIKSDPKAAEMVKVLTGLIKPTKRG